MSTFHTFRLSLAFLLAFSEDSIWDKREKPKSTYPKSSFLKVLAVLIRLQHHPSTFNLCKNCSNAAPTAWMDAHCKQTSFKQLQILGRNTQAIETSGRSNWAELCIALRRSEQVMHVLVGPAN